MKFNQILKDKSLKLYVLMTFNESLESWQASGLLDREMRLYIQYADNFKCEVTFITYGDERDNEIICNYPGMKCIPLYMSGKRKTNNFINYFESILFGWKMGRIINNEDVVKTKQFWGAWVGVIIKLVSGCRLVCRAGYDHTDFLKRSNKKGLRYIVSVVNDFIVSTYSDQIIVTTKKHKQYLTKMPFITRINKFHVLPNWIDAEIFKITKDFQSRNDACLFVGRLTLQKNIFLLLDISRFSKVPIDIIGNGPLRTDLSNAIKKNGVNISLLGTFPNTDMPMLYNNYKYYIMTSFYEGNPKTLLEALACGCVPIVADSPGISEIFVGQEFGILSNSADVGGFISAIKYLKQDQKTAERYSQMASEYIRKNFDFQVYLENEYVILNGSKLS